MHRFSSIELRGGVAIVTSAASGIGAALAGELAARGCALALADLDGTRLAQVAAAARATGVDATEHVLDVADAAAVAALPQAVLQAHGRVTVLVNNAGVALGGRFDQLSLADIEWLMKVNFWGTLRMTHAFLPALARERAAQVVNLSSVFGLAGPPGQTAYAASKFAVRGFSESLRHELDEAGSPVGVTVVHPGGVRTAIATSARLPAGATLDQVGREHAAWERLLVLTPQAAARRIVQGIRRREPRVLVGEDAVKTALVLRLFPVGYWKLMARDIARRIGDGR